MSEQSTPTAPYHPETVEAKWQARWQERRTNQPDLASAARPFYNLMMFPYPSAEGLHVGNLFAFTGADCYGRFKRLQGHQVFEPIGYDAFGIHSENFALKIGVHPADLIPRNIANFRRQLTRMGGMFDWRAELSTTDPSYYKWTQWLFLQLWKAGIAYKKKAAVNWCPSCKTVLANEQVEGGVCERCKTPVEQRLLEQWFFRISDYAERLLRNLDTLDWSETTLTAQRNWIGKSEGAHVTFRVDDAERHPRESGDPDGNADGPSHSAGADGARAMPRDSRSPALRASGGNDGGEEATITVFTTRPDTLFGATYMVLAPEHPLVDQITTAEHRAAVDAYRAAAQKMDVVARKVTREKTGEFTGAYAINPVNQRRIPIWIADYVLMDYGTGAIMAVPGHDERDFEFAQKFGLEIVRVVAAPGDDAATPLAEAYTDNIEGRIVNSGRFDGMTVPEAKRAMTEWLAQEGHGKRVVNYRLHDWCISRQRYWGPPIPIIYCDACGPQPVPEAQLPVELPRIEDYRPDDSGISPLARHEEWYYVACPACGAKARRETDVSDTFLDSAWYFLRYPSAARSDVPFDAEVTRRWLPVTSYIGGNEHAVLHLLYSRFITMVLHDQGLLHFEEPFAKFRAHGLIVKDGAKMSKSRGNVVVPDEYINKWGADVFRMYLMFLGPFQEGGDFRDEGISGPRRFLDKIWQLVDEAAREGEEGGEVLLPVKVKHQQTIQKATEDMEHLRYNTAIAAMMELVNALRDRNCHERRIVRDLVVMVAPFAPHFAEECWERLGGAGSVFEAAWPTFDPALTVEAEVTVAVQVNGKTRGTISIARNAAQEVAVAAALADEGVRRFVEGKETRKVIFVANRLLNLVVG